MIDVCDVPRAVIVKVRTKHGPRWFVAREGQEYGTYRTTYAAARAHLSSSGDEQLLSRSWAARQRQAVTS